MASFSMGVQIKGLNAAMASLKGYQKQVNFATAKSLTQVAHKVKRANDDELRDKTQGGATAYTLRAFKVTGARKDKLEAVVSLRTDMPGKGSVWARAIGHLYTGGGRDQKRMERAFQSVGVLPQGYSMVPAASSWAMKLDQYGNAPKGQIVQLLSYFRAFGEQGFKANMTDKRKAKIANVGRTAAGSKTINGVVYFVSYGKGKGSAGGDKFSNGRFDQHLPPGIWAKRGTHGSDVAPVFLFVRSGNYGQRFDLRKTGQRIIDEQWQRTFDAALSDAMRTAR